MDQSSAKQTLPLDPHFEIVQNLYRLVLDAQTPSYQIKKQLLAVEPLDLNAEATGIQYSAHGMTASQRLTKGVKNKEENSCLGDPIKILKARITRQHQIIDHDFALVANLLGAFTSTNIATHIVDVCPTVRDITPKPHGVGLLKAMGMLTGLALTFALHKQGKWSAFKKQLMCKDQNFRMCTVLDNLLILATRRSNDRLLMDVSDRFTRADHLNIANLLIPFSKMGKDKNVTKCRQYLEGFIPALLWPIYPQQRYFKDETDKSTGQSESSAAPKNKNELYQPDVEVVADRLFGKDFVKTLFAGTRVSKVWNDAGASFSEILEETMKSGCPEDDCQPFVRA